MIILFLLISFAVLQNINPGDLDAKIDGTGTFVSYDNNYFINRQDCTGIPSCEDIVVGFVRDDKFIDVSMNDGAFSQKIVQCHAFKYDSNTGNYITQPTATYNWKVYDESGALIHTDLTVSSSFVIPWGLTPTNNDIKPNKKYEIECTANLMGQSTSIRRTYLKTSFTTSEYPEVYDKSKYGALTSSGDSEVIKDVKFEVTKNTLKLLSDQSYELNFFPQPWVAYDTNSAILDVNVTHRLFNCPGNTCHYMKDLTFKNSYVKVPGESVTLKTHFRDTNNADYYEMANIFFYEKKPDVNVIFNDDFTKPLPTSITGDTSLSFKLDLSNSKYDPNVIASKTYSITCKDMLNIDCNEKLTCVDGVCYFNQGGSVITEDVYTLTMNVCVDTKCSDNIIITVNVISNADDYIEVKSDTNYRNIDVNNDVTFTVKRKTPLSSYRRGDASQQEQCFWKIDNVALTENQLKCENYLCENVKISLEGISHGTHDISITQGTKEVKFKMNIKEELHGNLIFDQLRNTIMYENSDDSNVKYYKFGFIDKNSIVRKKTLSNVHLHLWKNMKVRLTEENDIKSSMLSIPQLEENSIWVNARNVNGMYEEYKESLTNTLTSDEVNYICTSSINCDLNGWELVQHLYRLSYDPYCEKCEILSKLFWNKNQDYIITYPHYDLIKAFINVLYRSAINVQAIEDKWTSERRDVIYEDHKDPNCPIEVQTTSEVKMIIDNLEASLKDTCLNIDVKCDDSIVDIEKLVRELIGLHVQYDYNMIEVKKLYLLLAFKKGVLDEQIEDNTSMDVNTNVWYKTLYQRYKNDELCHTVSNVKLCVNIDIDYNGKVVVKITNVDASIITNRREDKEGVNVITDENKNTFHHETKNIEAYTEIGDVFLKEKIYRASVSFVISNDEKNPTFGKVTKYECLANDDDPTLCTYEVDFVNHFVTCVCEKEEDPGIEKKTLQSKITDYNIFEDPVGLGGLIGGLVGGISVLVILLALLVIGIVVLIVFIATRKRGKGKGENDKELEVSKPLVKEEEEEEEEEEKEKVEQKVEEEDSKV